MINGCQNIRCLVRNLFPVGGAEGDFVTVPPGGDICKRFPLATFTALTCTAYKLNATQT